MDPRTQTFPPLAQTGEMATMPPTYEMATMPPTTGSFNNTYTISYGAPSYGMPTVPMMRMTGFPMTAFGTMPTGTTRALGISATNYGMPTVPSTVPMQQPVQPGQVPPPQPVSVPQSYSGLRVNNTVAAVGGAGLGAAATAVWAALSSRR
jgi:hypothetical protein